jgi:hypothetical protein
MHSVMQRWLAFALFAGLVLAGASLAQPPGPEPEPSNGRVQPAPISVEDVVERLMAFDRNKDGKLTRDELPQRMHHLIELGDTNKDGALDREEIKKLVTTMALASGDFGFGGQIRVGAGPGARGGFGVGARGARGSFRVGDALRLGPDAVEGVVDDLKLSGQKKEQALAAVKAHQENVHKLMDQARAELLEKMKAILNEEEFSDFRAALDRPRGVTFFDAVGPGPRTTRSGGGQEKLDPPPR